MHIFKKIFIYFILIISNAYVRASEEPKIDLFSSQPASTIIHVYYHRKIYFIDREMDYNERSNMFALSQLKSVTSSQLRPVTSVEFMCGNLLESDVQYLCQNTSADWRAQVECLDFSLGNCKFKLTSECLSLILATFPNLVEFKSNSGLILDGPLTIPLMTSLEELSFYFDPISQDVLQTLKDSLLHLPALTLIRIGSTHLGDQCVPILISIKKERPTLELDCFNETGISDDGLKEVVQVFTELKYPQEINAGYFRSEIVEDYNHNHRIINFRNSNEAQVGRYVGPVGSWWDPSPRDYVPYS